MKAAVERFCKRCPTCQLYKNKKENYGHLPPKEAEVLPWEQVCIDLVGPYTIGNKANSDERTLHCLTMIDPATGWFEIEQIPSKRADEVMSVFENTWLGCYPRPMQVVMDRGTEFQAEVANSLVNDYGITRKLITTRNPQANAMVERAHQTIHNMVSILNLQGKNHEDPYHSWNGLLNAVRFAMKATVHSTTQATPMQLVFGRDAILPVTFQADWQYIKERKQRRIIQNNDQENAKRIPHTYAVGDKVTVEQHQHRKYGKPKYMGPYIIDRVFENGTVRLRQNTAHPTGVVYRTWNIRKIHPYQD